MAKEADRKLQRNTQSLLYVIAKGLSLGLRGVLDLLGLRTSRPCKVLSSRPWRLVLRVSCSTGSIEGTTHSEA